MIITKISGGLGNQMFQYAAGKALAVKHNTQLKLNIAYYDQEDVFKRSFTLDKFNITRDTASVEDMLKLRSKNRLSILMEKIQPRYKRKVIIEKPFEYFNDFEKIGADVYLDGYWQSEKYFKSIEPILKNEFTLKNVSEAVKEIISDMAKNNSVSIHVRRADYVNLKFVNDRYGVCPVEYYESAAKKVSEKVKNIHYYIFSDDAAWAKENLKLDGQVTIVSEMGFKDYEEMLIMSKCKHNIIANSSFGWWGAWLNLNPDKIIIAPIRWLKTDAYDASYILPDNWIKL